QTPPGQALRLVVEQPFLDHLDVWTLTGTQLSGPLRSGTLRPFDERGEPYPQFMFNLPPAPADAPTLLPPVQSQSAIAMPLQVVDSGAGQQLIVSSWLSSGLLVGAMLALALLYLIRFTTLRQAQLAYFSLTALCAAAYSAALYGIVGLLAGHWPQFLHVVINLSTLGMLIFSSLFLGSALKLPMRRLRWLRDPLFAASAVVCVGGLLSQHADTYRVLNLLILLTGAYQVGLLLLALHLRRPYAGGYLLCWGAVLLMMLLLPLSRMGLIPLLPGVQALHVYLPTLSTLLFGVLLDRQLEQVRRVLMNSQTQAINNLEQYQALFRNSGEGIFRCRRNGTLLEANPSLARLLDDDPGAATLRA